MLYQNGEYAVNFTVDLSFLQAASPMKIDDIPMVKPTIHQGSPRYPLWFVDNDACWWYTYPSEKYGSQLGLWHSQHMETCSKPPTRCSFQISRWFHSISKNAHEVGITLSGRYWIDLPEVANHNEQLPPRRNIGAITDVSLQQWWLGGIFTKKHDKSW